MKRYIKASVSADVRTIEQLTDYLESQKAHDIKLHEELTGKYVYNYEFNSAKRLEEFLNHYDKITYLEVKEYPEKNLIVATLHTETKNYIYEYVMGPELIIKAYT